MQSRARSMPSAARDSAQRTTTLTSQGPRRLDSHGVYRYTKSMAQSFLVFDFGSDEELAQQARHRVDGWKQGFRLDKKLLLKFDRSEAPETLETSETAEKPAAKS